MSTAPQEPTDEAGLTVTVLPAEVEGERRSVRVRVAGELDVHSAAILRERLVEIDESGCDRIVLDLGALAFIDSAGIGVLVGALRRAEARGASMVVVHTPRSVRAVFDMTHLTAAFSIEDPGP
jgi:anti-sigma B factor antagonist